MFFSLRQEMKLYLFPCTRTFVPSWLTKTQRDTQKDSFLCNGVIRGRDEILSQLTSWHRRQGFRKKNGASEQGATQKEYALGSKRSTAKQTLGQLTLRAVIYMPHSRVCVVQTLQEFYVDTPLIPVYLAPPLGDAHGRNQVRSSSLGLLTSKPVCVQSPS